MKQTDSAFRLHTSSFLQFRGGNLLDYIGFDLVADLDIVKVLQANATLETFTHFRNVVLETTQRSNVTFPTDHAVANQSRARVAANVAVDNHGTRNHTRLGNAENFAHVGLADDALFFNGLEHTDHRRANLFFN